MFSSFLTGQVLRALGLTEAAEAKARAHAGQRPAVLRFESGRTCKFLRKEERRVEGSTKHVREYMTGVIKGGEQLSSGPTAAQAAGFSCRHLFHLFSLSKAP